MINHYRELCQQWQTEFDRNRRLHGSRIHCRPGCSDCCGQLFQITEIEAGEVSRGFHNLPGSLQDRLRSRAAQYTLQREELLASLGEIECWGSLPPPGARLACPALEDGVCLIYEHRPLICRKFGIPLWNPDTPGRVHACELNFSPGEEIDDPHLVQIQTDLRQQAKQLQANYNAAALPRHERPITVARAMIEDFSSVIP